MSPQQLMEGNAQLCAGRGRPLVAPAHPRRPGLQPGGPRAGQGHLWWLAWRKEGRRGEKPKAGQAGEGLTELHHSCLRVSQLGAPLPDAPQIQSQLSQWGREESWPLGYFFFLFFFLVIKKFLGLGEILCATAVPRGVLPPTPLPLPPGGREEEEFLGRAKVGEGGTISHPPQSWKKRPSRAGTGCQVPAEGTRCPAPPGAPPLSRPGRPGCAVAGPAAG